MEKLSKFVITLVSVSMFCVQFKISIMNLISPPTVDTSFQEGISEISHLPLITICPTDQQPNKTRLKKFGYRNVEDMMKGYTKCQFGLCLSWGKHVNMSFDDLLKEVFDKIQIFTTNEFITRITFLPPYGFCKEITAYDPLLTIKVFGRFNFRVFVTDSRYRSHFSPDYSSHQGENIISSINKSHVVDIKVNILSTCKIAGLIENDFEKCVDDEIQRKLGATLGCVFPWLSSTNQCSDTYLRNFTNAVSDFRKVYISNIMTLGKTEFEKSCRKACMTTTSTARTRTTKNYHTTNMIQIQFEDNVRVTETVYNYDLFQFIIDAGSSLGLWLGLSMLNLHDIFVLGIDFIKRYRSEIN